MATRDGGIVYQDRKRCWTRNAMHDELCHALHQALYELDVLPADQDAALMGLCAIIDDLRAALDRVQALEAATPV